MGSLNSRHFQRNMQSPTRTVPTAAKPDQTRLAQRLETYFKTLQKDDTIRVRYNGEYHSGRLQPADSYRVDGSNR